MKSKYLFISLLIVITLIVITWLLAPFTDPSTFLHSVSSEPRRYVDLTPWVNFEKNKPIDHDLDFTFSRVVYLILVLYSIALIRKLRIQNIVFVLHYCLCTGVSGFFLFLNANIKTPFIQGLNPGFMYVIFYCLFAQLLTGIYLMVKFYYSN